MPRAADRQARGQPACWRTPAAARRGAARPAGIAEFPSRAEGLPAAAPEMRLHCEVEVVSRHLPALGLRNRGKGVRALLSLCQQAPRSPPRPPAGGAGTPRRACLLVATLKDKRGTRYEVSGARRALPLCALGPCPGVPRLERAWGS